MNEKHITFSQENSNRHHYNDSKIYRIIICDQISLDTDELWGFLDYERKYTSKVISSLAYIWDFLI